MECPSDPLGPALHPSRRFGASPRKRKRAIGLMRCAPWKCQVGEMNWQALEAKGMRPSFELSDKMQSSSPIKLRSCFYLAVLLHRHASTSMSGSRKSAYCFETGGRAGVVSKGEKSLYK